MAHANLLLVKQLTDEIAERAIQVRKEHHMKIPDAVVYATAQKENVF